MKPFVVALACCVLCASPLLAQDPDYSTAPLERLVDDLALIDSATPGLASMATYKSFIAVDERPVFTGGVIGIQTPDGGVRKPRAPDVPPQMREIVRRGIRALPVLMQHLDDARPTKLVLGGSKYDGGFFMSQWFGEEYHARTRPASGARDKVLTFTDRHFEGKYTVKVGDVCYVLIGQIVNRELRAVRYQPPPIWLSTRPLKPLPS